MTTYMSKYRNAYTDPNLGLNLLMPDGTAITPETEGKGWTFLDKLFGAADKTVDIYGNFRQTQLYGPPPPMPNVPPRNPNTIAYVIGGVVVIGIITVLIIKK